MTINNPVSYNLEIWSRNKKHLHFKTDEIKFNFKT